MSGRHGMTWPATERAGKQTVICATRPGWAVRGVTRLAKLCVIGRIIISAVIQRRQMHCLHSDNRHVQPQLSCSHRRSLGTIRLVQQQNWKIARRLRKYEVEPNSVASIRRSLVSTCWSVSASRIKKWVQGILVTEAAAIDVINVCNVYKEVLQTRYNVQDCCTMTSKDNRKTGILISFTSETYENFITKTGHFDYVVWCNMHAKFYGQGQGNCPTTSWNITSCDFLYLAFLFSCRRLQQKRLDVYYRSIQQTTSFQPRMCLLEMGKFKVNI